MAPSGCHYIEYSYVCQRPIDLRALPVVRAAPERSVGSGGAVYTITGSRCIGWKVFPRLTTRGSTLSATPRSTSTT